MKKPLFVLLPKALLISLLILFIPNLSHAQNQKNAKASTPPASGQIRKNQPMHLRHADFFSSDSTKEQGQVTKFWGHVDIFLEENQITINADTVWVYSSTKTYIAVGHVKITKEDPEKGTMIATAQKARYEQKQTENLITLEGIPRPKIIQGQNKLTGDILVIRSSDEGSTFEGTNVSGDIYPESKDTVK